MGEWKYSFTPDEWSAESYNLFTARDRGCVTCYIGGWMGPISGLDTL
jgi:hypothetical protein